MPQFSIILPAYNGALYIRESIDSVLAQSFPDFELLVLDDGSTDETAAYVQSYGDARVRYSKNPGRFGLFKTVNRGIEQAASPWVKMWAQDDRMLSTCLGRFHEFITRHSEVGMAYCEFHEIDETGRRNGSESIHAAQNDRTPDVAGPETAALLFLSFGCMPSNISTCMLNKAAFGVVGRFVEGIQQAPDYEMWVRISRTYPIGFVREPLVEVRKHPGQLSRLGHKHLTLIAEEKMVYDALQVRLSAVVPEREFRRFWRSYKGRMHMHMIARAFLRGDWSTAAQGWEVLKPYGNRIHQLLHWLRTANGRIMNTDRVAFFDAVAERLRRVTVRECPAGPVPAAS